MEAAGLGAYVRATVRTQPSTLSAASTQSVYRSYLGDGGGGGGPGCGGILIAAVRKAVLLPGTLSVGAQSPCLQSPGWAHGSQFPWSVLSRERLLVFRGEMGLGGLLRLELLEAVECLGESESSPS